MDNRLIAFERLLNIMDDLREKCPWDKKQTIHTLRKLTIEETYELVDAITENDWQNIKEELGDLFLHLVFYAKIGKEENKFDITDVLNGVSDKLIKRHPHIYGNETATTEEEVKINWEKIKLQEGRNSVLDGVPKSLPAVTKAQRIQEKVKQVGFDWDNKNQVWDKVNEELQELQEAVVNNDKIETEKEFGDVLFALINYARFLDIDAENCLELTNKKFIKRFQWLEKFANENNKDLKQMNLEQLDVIWNKAKIQVG